MSICLFVVQQKEKMTLFLINHLLSEMFFLYHLLN